MLYAVTVVTPGMGKKRNADSRDGEEEKRGLLGWLIHGYVLRKYMSFLNGIGW